MEFSKRKTVCIVQARTGSSRLPNKVLKSIGPYTALGLMLERLKLAKEPDEIVLATSLHKRDSVLVELAKEHGIKLFRGDEDDVLNRFYRAAVEHRAETIVRLTGDCPFVDPRLLDEMLVQFREGAAQYLTNTLPPTYPDGLDIEVMSIEALKAAEENANTSLEREHVTTYLRSDESIKRQNIVFDLDCSALRWTLDEQIDLEQLNLLFKKVNYDPTFDARALALDLISQNIKPDSIPLRNEGLEMLKGQKHYRYAKTVIPGGTMLLSKRPEMFLPNHWPAYYKKAKGVEIWDLDNRRYVDMSIMGVGTNILGYAHEEVDEAAISAIKSSNMSTLNSPSEVYLAEKLIKLHPWAGGVRYARSGGEANAIAVRIARAYAKNDRVAICGYHGWHDWYLSINLTDEDGLSSHLLPGLSTLGVPSNLRGTTFPFSYNNIEEFEALVEREDIGVVKMEVVRSEPPAEGYLERIRQVCNQRGMVLIFDECTSGFRQCNGGIHKLHSVQPDIAMFGKALGNGYAITAVVGKKEIMDVAQDTFISSTFWTERIGPEAALKCLEVMERERSWEVISDLGRTIRKQWRGLADEYGLDIDISGIPALSGFQFNYKDHQKYKTLITQEMLKKGFLAANTIYVSTAHTEEHIEEYFSNLENCFRLISDCQNGERNIDDLLNGPVAHMGFTRLN